RPVDPPPIVQLRIFDGHDSETDVTFSMNANYFLFATLEQARPMAHGRVSEDKQRLTVLTGTPVAGM
ncbi:velum formation- protein, partial [Teratosphaeriaceae sp. CCFEE 6253]